MLVVTATDLPRLMACNGSRLMGVGVAPIDADDTVRKEGIAAHWLVEQVHVGRHAAEELIDRKAPNGIFITAEMVEHVEQYLNFIHGGDIEIDTSFAGQNWQINGRADGIKYHPAKQQLDVPDLKYGWSIIEPEWNWTLIAHVLGFIARNPDKPVRYAEMTIFQPRPHHHISRVRSWGIGYEAIAKLSAELNATLSNPTDILNTGGHCYRCPALATCPAARKAQMNAIDASEMVFIDNISNDNLSFQLDHLKRATEMLSNIQKAYSELAEHRIRAGQIVNNYSLETELTNKQWKENITPELMLMLTGKDLSKKQMVTPNQAKKLGISEDIIEGFVERHNKGVKLVRIDADKKAKKLFGGK